MLFRSEDMRSKGAGSLVRYVSRFQSALFEVLTPAIATDFISDMVKRVGGVWESYVKTYVGSMLW